MGAALLRLDFDHRPTPKHFWVQHLEEHSLGNVGVPGPHVL